MSGYNGAPGPAPPWSQVIATTVRLWCQRRVLAPAARRVRWLGYRRIGVAALIISLVALSATIAHLATSAAADPSQGRPADSSGQASGTAAGTEQLAVAAADRSEAARWIAAQVGPGVIVSCDPLMCAALTRHGFPAANVATLGPGASDPLASSIVVSTTAVRSELGSRLTSVYAPVVIASFGTGASQVQVRVVAPDGTAAYLAAEKADVRARQVAGRELIGNNNVHLSAAAREQLAAGEVDARLLITLGALAHRYAVVIRSFSDSGPGATSGSTLRSMDIVAPDAAYSRQVLAFLNAQRAPLRALDVARADGTTTVITIEFTAPSPLGLLSQN